MTRQRIILLSLALLLSLTICAQDLNEELWTAARKGDAAAVKALLAKGADVNAKFRYGATALSYAADKGHLEVVKVVLGKAGVKAETLSAAFASATKKNNAEIT